MRTRAFHVFQDGMDVASAFAAAQAGAAYDIQTLAPQSWWQTLADKAAYIVVEHEPLPQTRAVHLSRQLLRREQFAKPDGPAGAIPVTGGRRAHLIDIPPGVSATEWITDELSRRLTKGEKVTSASIAPHWDVDARGNVRHGTVVVPTIGASVHTGWLFFGTASLTRSTADRGGRPSS